VVSVTSEIRVQGHPKNDMRAILNDTNLKRTTVLVSWTAVYHDAPFCEIGEILGVKIATFIHAQL